MAKTTAIYVTPGGSRWQVKLEGVDRAIADFASKDEAIDYARGYARTKSYPRVVVLNEAGATESEESFALVAH